MAFQIHRDSSTQILKTKIVHNAENNKIQYQNNSKNSKIPIKRLPLQSNVCSNRNQKLKTEAGKENVCYRSIPNKIESESQIQIYTDTLTVKDPQNKENKPSNFRILEEIPTFNNIANKENLENNQDSRESFYFSIDRHYLTTSEYHDSICAHLLNLERSLNRPKPDYMSKQSELSYKMRSILVDWLSAVAEEYDLQPQTLHLAVQYIDCFLSRMSVVKNKFQLVGTAAMMIAAKYEEIYPPDTNEWSYLTADAYTIKQLLRMEHLILKVLNFDMAQPTAYTFIAHMCSVCNLPKKVMLLAMYFSELVLLEGEDYMRYFPSELAFASVALARHTLNEKQLWPKNLEIKTGYSLKQLHPLIKKQHKSFKDSPTKEQQAIQQKFKSVKYDRVSLLKPNELYLDEMEQ